MGGDTSEGKDQRQTKAADRLGDAANEQGDKIEGALTRIMYDYGTTAAIGTAVLSAVIAVLALEQSDPFFVVCWTVVAIAVSGARAYLIDRYQPAEPSTTLAFSPTEDARHKDHRWLMSYVFLTLISAAIWFAAGMWLYPSVPGSAQTLFVVVLSGVAAVACKTLFANKAAVVSMILLPTLPVAWHFASPQAGEPSLFGALIVMLFCAVLLRLALNSHELLRRTLGSEYETKQLIVQSEGLICTHDKKGVLLSVNQAVCNSLGRSEQEMVGHSLLDFIAPVHTPVFHGYLKMIWQEGRVGGHLELLNRQGETRIWAFRNKLYQPISGPRYVIGHAQDVTDSLRLQRWLKETIDLLPAEFSRFNSAGELVLMNQMFSKTADGVELGLTHQQVLELQAEQGRVIDAQENPSAWVHNMLTEFDDPEPQVLDQQRDSDEWISIRAQRARDGSLISIGTDISHSKQLESELRRAECELEARVIRRTQELQSSEENLKRSEERLQDYANTAADYYWELDTELCYRHIEGRFEELTGLKRDDALDKCVANLWQGHVQKPQRLERRLRRTYEKQISFSDAELRWQHADGFERVMHISGQPFFSEEGELLGYRGSGHDVTELTHLAERLEFEANHDALTGLYNRREFERTLRVSLATARTGGENHVLGYVDLDRFKIINDTCGHMAGDELLTQLGALLHSTIKVSHTLARLGGDEFGFLLTNCTLVEGKHIAGVLLSAIENFRFAWDDQQFAVGASIGVIPINRSSGGMKNVMQAADAACYTAKSNGRNQVVVQVPGDSGSAGRQEEVKLISQIVAAIDRDELLLTVQPIVPSDRSGNLYDHFEILVAMENSAGKQLRAGAFMPLAERYGLAVRIDRWVVGATVDWLQSHPDALNEFSLCSINLSGTSLGDPSMPEYLMSCLQGSGIDPRKLCFEITETSAISNWQQAMSLITMIRKLGCQFALDDFGTGLSSFAYLKKLPVDYVKIDGAFVAGIETDSTNHAIVKSICEVARSTGKQTVAEFVDTDATAEILRNIGVDYLQGYGIGLPMPIDVLAEAAGQIPFNQASGVSAGRA